MDKIRMLFQQAMTISFGILIGMSLEGIIYLDDINFRWYHPASIILAGIVCSIPSLILYNGENLPRQKYRLRIILHFISLFAVVMGMGRLFCWYTVLEGAIYVAVIFVFVYCFVWICSTSMGAHDQKNINNALEGIRDEE